MKLHIDNIYGFNDVFGTHYINIDNDMYEVDLAALGYKTYEELQKDAGFYSTHVRISTEAEHAEAKRDAEEKRKVSRRKHQAKPDSAPAG